VIGRIAKKKGLILRREDELHQTIGRNIREQRKLRGADLEADVRAAPTSRVAALADRARRVVGVGVVAVQVATALDVRITELFGDF